MRYCAAIIGKYGVLGALIIMLITSFACRVSGGPWSSHFSFVKFCYSVPKDALKIRAHATGEGERGPWPSHFSAE